MQQLNNNQRKLILHIYNIPNDNFGISAEILADRGISVTEEDMIVLADMKYLTFSIDNGYYQFHLLPAGKAAYERFIRESEEYCEKRNDIKVATKLSKQSNRISLCALIIAALAFIFSVFAYFHGA